MSDPLIFPALRYRDAPAAIDWLVTVLGFEAGGRFDNDDGTVAHAELHLGAAGIMLGTDRPDGVGHPPGGTSTYLAVDDVPARWERATQAGADVVRELAEMDYGSQEFSLRDPEGNLWSVGTYRPERAGG